MSRGSPADKRSSKLQIVPLPFELDTPTPSTRNGIANSYYDDETFNRMRYIYVRFCLLLNFSFNLPLSMHPRSNDPVGFRRIPGVISRRPTENVNTNEETKREPRDASQIYRKRKHNDYDRPSLALIPSSPKKQKPQLGVKSVVIPTGPSCHLTCFVIKTSFLFL